MLFKPALRFRMDRWQYENGGFRNDGTTINNHVISLNEFFSNKNTKWLMMIRAAFLNSSRV